MCSTKNPSPLEQHRDVLLLESALSSEALGSGLTSLRRYDFADKGPFYAGMFSVTIGLERLLKLIFVVNHAQTTGAFPGNQDLKAVGHDLKKLMAKAQEIGSTDPLNVDASALDDTLCNDIIGVLADFARFSRYYNLNSIVGATKPGDEEPLAAWDRVVGREVVKRHHRVTKKQRDGLEFAKALSQVPGVVVAHTLEDGSYVRDALSLEKAAGLAETKQKYSVYYVLRVIEFCVDVLRALDFQNSTPTYVFEYFRIFSTLDRRAVLRRKKWKPLA